ncbi:MAG: bifunctional nuclease family protein [Acidimicrobiales bacterium]
MIEEALAEKPAPRPGAVVVDGPIFETEVRLKERAGDRVLDIGIGVPEAQAIALGLNGVLQPRPMTHDFITNLLHALDDVSVLRVVVSKRERETFHELQHRDDVVITERGEPWTFHARLELRHRDRVVNVDCRPSDGIALAVRLGVPILAADELEPVVAAA